MMAGYETEKARSTLSVLRVALFLFSFFLLPPPRKYIPGTWYVAVLSLTQRTCDPSVRIVVVLYLPKMIFV